MIFTSDNAIGAAPEVLEAIMAANSGGLPSYGEDDAAKAVERKLSEIFERPVRAFMVATGTAANALTLATLSPPWGAIYCHKLSHIEEDECGAPEFFTSGARLTHIAGEDAKIDPQALEEALKTALLHGVHQVQPSALSLTNLTERGTLYSADDVKALCEVARGHKLRVHLDGARFSNAIIASGASPAEMSWKAGVDALVFGAAKNGCLGVETVVLFDDSLADEFAFRRKRAGHLLSKGRLFSAQMSAFLADDNWLNWARRANAMGARLAQGLEAQGIKPQHPVQGNMIFTRLPRAGHEALQQAGARYYETAPWEQGAHAEGVAVRLVASFLTSEDEVDGFLRILAQAQRDAA